MAMYSQTLPSLIIHTSQLIPLISQKLLSLMQIPWELSNLRLESLSEVQRLTKEFAHCQLEIGTINLILYYYKILCLAFSGKEKTRG